nr:MAG TPA: hypothetical protein [Caudoviricetes sp.]DAR99777.1 MAG TPA: hypothetical protein [Caudoviricetes sp.]
MNFVEMNEVNEFRKKRTLSTSAVYCTELT